METESERGEAISGVSEQQQALLLENTVKSWIGDYKGCNFRPKMRKQKDIHRHSCSAHALSRAVEMRSWKKWADTNVRCFEKRKKYEIDVAKLVKSYPPPSHPSELIDKLIHDSRGCFKTVQGSKSKYFKVCDHLDYLFDNPNITVEEKVKYIIEVGNHIDRNGPVVGAFPVSVNFKPTVHDVYVFDSVQAKMKGDKKGKKILLSHAVCLTGTALVVLYGGEVQPAFQYYDSADPVKNSKKGDGISYVLWSSLKLVTVPILKS